MPTSKPPDLAVERDHAPTAAWRLPTSRRAIVRHRIVRAAAAPRRYAAAVSERSRFDELAHQVNNLLATIEIQGEVARTIGSEQAFRDALEMIRSSADRTREHVERLRAESEA